jgi:hypothetical protein
LGHGDLLSVLDKQEEITVSWPISTPSYATMALLKRSRMVADSFGFDTYYYPTLITKSLRKKLLYVEEVGRRDLPIPGGMSIEVTIVKIGIQIGSIIVPEAEAAVVDNGRLDIILGETVLGDAFRLGRSGNPEESSRSSSEAKEDAGTLSIELYPVAYPFRSTHLERILKNQRILYNIALIALDKVNAGNLPPEHLDSVICDESGIPDSLRLKISLISEGSVWVSLTSGCQSALTYLANFFQKGATAKLEQEVADSKKSEIDVEISRKTRDAVAFEIISEKEKLRAENIHQTYESVRRELRAQVSFWDDLIMQASDPTLIEELKKRKDKAICVFRSKATTHSAAKATSDSV